MPETLVAGTPASPVIASVVTQWRRVLLVTVAAALLAFGVSALQPVEYTAEASLLLADPRNTGLFGETGVNFLDPSRYVRNQAEFAQSNTVLHRASILMDGRLDVQAIRDQSLIRPATDLDQLTIEATDSTANGAASLANALGEAYQAVVREESARSTQASLSELQAQRSDLQETIDRLDERLSTAPSDTSSRAERDAAVNQLISINSRIDQIAVDSVLFGSGVELFERAVAPRTPSAPTPIRNALLVGILGALGAGTFAWWRADERATADDRNDPSRMLKAPLLGTVPSFDELGLEGSVPTVEAPKSPAGEAYQFLVGALAFALAESGGRSVVLTSASPVDGKTVTCLNLAVAAAQDGRAVVLVDADTRVRGLTRRLAAKDTGGLPALADSRNDLADIVVPLTADEGKHVPFIPAKSLGDDTAAFFRTPGFRQAISRLKDVADLIIVDSPPLLLASDASAIATNVDGIVVVVARGTSLKLLAEMRERLDRIGTPVLGYIYTKAKLDGGGYGDYAYRYGYSYAYGYGETPADRRGSKASKGRRRNRGSAAETAMSE
ncbi:tyrosine-protein kinase domain-containing protein [Euzebya rosea]|uniref:tyrosine-protein kinase domain-containing protein n=1 Tax=Euzebya rosea TaxID=2052804 RepID=UPI001300AA44|nr:lipopolysaccharide biosynthesis protein [Euzebya rosea]